VCHYSEIQLLLCASVLKQSEFLYQNSCSLGTLGHTVIFWTVRSAVLIGSMFCAVDEAVRAKSGSVPLCHCYGLKFFCVVLTAVRAVQYSLVATWDTGAADRTRHPYGSCRRHFVTYFGRCACLT
jgi:hypothetical protein